MKVTSIGINTIFVYQCAECNHVIWHSDMKETHIADIQYCPYCGHKLEKDNIDIKHL